MNHKSIPERIRALTSSSGDFQFARASVWYLIANTFGNGIVLLSSAVFTRLMTKADYGLVNTYSAWVLVLNTFIGLNLFITVRNAYIDHRENYESYCSSLLLLVLLANVAFTVAAVALSTVLPLKINPVEAVFACVQASSVHLINYRSAILSMENRFQQRSLLLILPHLTHTMLSVALILAFRQNMYLAKIAGNSLGMLIYAVICAICVFSTAPPHVNNAYWKYALAISLPAIIHTLSDLILVQSDRLMLTTMVNAEETAEYSLIYNVGAIIMIIYQAINGAWTPWFYQRAAAGEREESRRCQEVYLYVFSLITAGVVSLAPEMIKILSPSVYWPGICYVGWIVIASFLVFLSAFYSSWLMSKKKTGIIARNTAVTALVNLLLNYLLIPRLYAAGAVIATVVGYALLFTLHCLSAGKEGRSYFDLRKMLVIAVCVAIYCCLTTLLRAQWWARYLLFLLAVGCSAKWYGTDLIQGYLKRKNESS